MYTYKLYLVQYLVYYIRTFNYELHDGIYDTTSLSWLPKSCPKESPARGIHTYQRGTDRYEYAGGTPEVSLVQASLHI